MAGRRDLKARHLLCRLLIGSPGKDPKAAVERMPGRWATLIFVT
jgi:hypothetical protein